MPPEDRAYSSNSIDSLWNDYQYRYYIPTTLEHYLDWLDHSVYQIKYDFFKKKKKIKHLEIE